MRTPSALNIIFYYAVSCSGKRTDTEAAHMSLENLQIYLHWDSADLESNAYDRSQ